jgi:hypothetical protein
VQCSPTYACPQTESITTSIAEFFKYVISISLKELLCYCTALAATLGLHNKLFLFMLSRHVVSCRARPVVQLSFMHKARRTKYSAAAPVTLLEEFTQRGFIHDVTR